MSAKLRAILKGHKGAVAKIYTKFELEQSHADEATNMVNILSTEESLTKKIEIISTLHERILDVIPEDRQEEIEFEVLEQEEYIFNLQTKLQMVRSYRVSHSNINNSHAASVSNDYTSFHRLPKLELPTFSRSVIEWQAYWDAYESAIHENSSLSSVQKFNYLRSTLNGEALQTVSGFSLTNANYEKAVALLHERFGQTDKIIQSYMMSLLEIPAPTYTFSSLREFYDSTEVYIRGLDSLGQNEDTYGSLLVPVIIQKLPHEIRRNITRAHGTSWTLGILMKCLLEEVNILDAGSDMVNSESFRAATPYRNCSSTATFLTKSENKRPVRKRVNNLKSTIPERKCAFCNGSHACIDCVNVPDSEQRRQIVKRDRLCFNCLGKHKVFECKSRFKCRNCARRHHTSICDVKPTSEGNTHNANESNSSVLHSARFPTGPVLLKTAVSTVKSATTETCANILFDEGSQSSFVCETLAQKLQLQRTGSESLSLSGFGDTTRRVRHLDTATVYLKTSKENIPIKVLIVPDISVPIKTYQKQASHHAHLRKLQLAHPSSDDDNFNIEMLIGADHYWDVVQDNVVRGCGPTAIQSKIGYLLSGPLQSETQKDSSPFPVSMMNVMTMHVQEEINLEQFWEVESMGLEQNTKCKDYEEYTRQYQDTCISYEEGKYVAKLPWKDDHSALPSNELISRRRTVNVINRLRKEPDLLQKYGEIIEEQEERGFIERVADDTENSGSKVHYIPHHHVKKDSATTPIRIVYDCSCKANRDSPSLNECLMNIPPHLNDLTAILLRFRQHQFAVTTDIEKAFLNISLHPDDRDATRFFWLSDPNNPDSDLQTYRFKSVLFGATCSPFILNATIMKHLDRHQCGVTQIANQGLYVDNILTSIPDETALLEFYTGSRHIFQQAAFNLRSWSTNNPALLQKIESDGVKDQDQVTKVLGMRWNPELDELSFPQRLMSSTDDSRLTKRVILKEVSSIYDPLGLLSPVTVKGKMLMQSLWKRKFEWDEVLPREIIIEWCRLREDMLEATKTRFSRRYFPDSSLENAALHIFTDASTKAYGACAYLVCSNQSTLVMAKNRVAPLKQLTIPKLELCAALIGAKLGRHILSSINCENVYFWSDSQIVLSWISSHKQLPLFVSRRVAEIKELTNGFQWRYCPTDSNPADILSRGLTYNKFRDNNLWNMGPSWITDETQFPVERDDNTTVDDSCPCDATGKNNEAAVLTTTCDNSGILEIIDIKRFSSYFKLLRVTAYIIRFVNNCRYAEKTRGSLQSHEINAAAKQLIQYVQSQQYPEVKQYLCHGGHRPNLVRQLDLFLDDSKLIRCRGRLSNAPLLDCTKFPYLLPANDTLTNLIVMDAHVTHLHSGVEGTVTFLRHKFWIPSIRQRVRKVIRACVTCRKVTSKPYRIPDPPPLPANRLKHAPPFTVTGIDFTGALTVKTPTGELQKTYICLFTCANTRAVHLELVQNMAVDSFVLALRRFFSRRAFPKVIMSDNARTFMATAKAVEEEILGKYGTTWTFIPQHAPWYGGWWERLVGITKTCIKKVLGKSLVSLEVLQTIVAEVECIINDRPLTYTSSDPTDEEPLTPSHLLHGRRITSPVYPNDDDDIETDNISRDSADKLYRFKSAVLDHFWRRWKNEYLTSLRAFHTKSGNHGDTVTPGDVVQIHDGYQPRNRWALGVVEDVVVGGDRQVRAANIRTKRGVTTRPIAKLYPLELK